MDNEKELRDQIANLKEELRQLVAGKGRIDYWYCSRCREAKPISEFSRQKNGTPKCYCRTCVNVTTSAYTRTPEGRERQKQANGQVRASETYQQRKAARGILSDRIQRKLFPAAKTLTCTECGKPANVYHHFNGYNPEHWDEVIPVCNRCHRRIHNEPSAPD